MHTFSNALFECVMVKFFQRTFLTVYISGHTDKESYVLFFWGNYKMYVKPVALIAEHEERLR